MPVLDNPKHERFAQNLAKGMNVTDAYVDAGYKFNDGNCSRLKGDERINERVKEILAMSADKAALDRSWVLDRLMRNAQMCMAEIPVKTTMKDSESGEWIDRPALKHDPSAANKALELLGKTEELSMFIERKEVGGPGAFDKMTTDEIKQYIRERSAQLGGSVASPGDSGTSGKPRSQLN